MEIFKKNISLLIERYPEYTFFPFKKEHILNHSFKKNFKNNFEKIDSIDFIYVYGFCRKSFYFLQDWVNKKEERDVVFIEDDFKGFLSFLSTKEASYLLQNPKMHFFYNNKLDKDFLKKIVLNFFCEKIKIFSLKESENFSFIKKNIIEYQNYFSAIYADELCSNQHFENFLFHMKNIKSSFFLNSLKNKCYNIPAVICGAGPSLELFKKEIRQLENKAIILAAGSAISALSSYNIFPHISVLIDPNKEEFLRVKNSKIFNVPILYTSRVIKDVFLALNGPLGYFKSSINSSFSRWMEKELSLEKSFSIGKGLGINSFSVTPFAISICKFLGCSPIFLCGVDLAFFDDKKYALGVLKKENNILQDEKILQEKDIYGKKVFTTVNWKLESKTISFYVKRHKLKVFNLSKGIGFDGIENKNTLNFFTKDIDIRGHLHSCFLSFPFKKKQKKINNLFLLLQKSFSRSKDHIENILKEIESFKITEKKDLLLINPFIEMEKDSLEKEIAYKLLSNTLFVLDKKLEKLYRFLQIKQSIKNYKSINEKRRKILFERWSLIKEIIDLHLKCFIKNPNFSFF